MAFISGRRKAGITPSDSRSQPVSMSRSSPLRRPGGAGDLVLDSLGAEIQAALRADITAGARLAHRGLPPDPDGPEFNGYCAAAAAAYLFLVGEDLSGVDPVTFVDDEEHWRRAGAAARKAGYRSLQASLGSTSHWWLERESEDRGVQIIDLIHGPGDREGSYPYEVGRSRGFQQTGYLRPASRAKAIIGAVKAARERAARLPSEMDDLRSPSSNQHSQRRGVPMSRRAFITLWKGEQLEIERLGGEHGRELRRTGSDQFGASDVAPGDDVYVVALEKRGARREMLLIGRLTVERKLTKAQAQAEADDAVFDAAWHLVGVGSSIDIDRVVPEDVVREIRRASGTPVKLDSDGVNPQTLRKFGEITQASAAALEALL